MKRSQEEEEEKDWRYSKIHKIAWKRVREKKGVSMGRGHTHTCLPFHFCEWTLSFSLSLSFPWLNVCDKPPTHHHQLITNEPNPQAKYLFLFLFRSTLIMRPKKIQSFCVIKWNHTQWAWLRFFLEQLSVWDPSWDWAGVSMPHIQIRQVTAGSHLGIWLPPLPLASPDRPKRQWLPLCLHWEGRGCLGYKDGLLNDARVALRGSSPLKRTEPQKAWSWWWSWMDHWTKRQKWPARLTDRQRWSMSEQGLITQPVWHSHSLIIELWWQGETWRHLSPFFTHNPFVSSPKKMYPVWVNLLLSPEMNGKPIKAGERVERKWPVSPRGVCRLPTLFSFTCLVSSNESQSGLSPSSFVCILIEEKKFQFPKEGEEKLRHDCIIIP